MTRVSERAAAKSNEKWKKKQKPYTQTLSRLWLCLVAFFLPSSFFLSLSFFFLLCFCVGVVLLAVQMQCQTKGNNAEKQMFDGLILNFF